MLCCRAGVPLVQQTIKRGVKPNSPYVIDNQRKRNVDLNDNAAVVSVIRDALAGQLL
mgnify:CR=1 FL=1